MSNETQVTPGHDRYGHFVIVNGFRSAMPDEAAARFFAAAPEMAALLERLCIAHNVGMSQSDYMQAITACARDARALLAKIKGADHA